MCSWGLDEWGDIANIVIAVASVATAIVTAVVLVKQRKENIKERQPRITFSTQDGTLIVRADNSRLLKFIEVKLYEYVEISYRDKTQKKEIKRIVPIMSSGAPFIRTAADGQFISISTDIMLYAKLNKKLDCVAESNFVVYRLLNIKYMDIHLSEQYQYFLNGNIITPREYKRYIKMVDKTNIEPQSLKDIDFKTLLE